MYIPTQMNEVLLAIHPYAPEASRKKSPSASLLSVHRLYVGVKQYVDELGEGHISFLSEEKVVVIGHQAIRDHGSAILLVIAFDQT